MEKVQMTQTSFGGTPRAAHPARPLVRLACSLCTLVCATIWTTPHLLAQTPQVVPSAEGHHVAWTDGHHVTLPTTPRTLLGQVASEGTSWWVPATESLDGTTRLALWHGAADKAIASLTVREAADKVLFGPTPVVDADGLQGVLWSEGTQIRKTEIRFSTWQDGALSEPAILSPKGEGTQTGLSATVLADGSWLAVWTAQDGEDSEVTWSRYRQGSWTAPKTLTDNAVPDITPHVRATAYGTYLAWSRYDGNGHYRIVMARFDDDAKDGQGAWSSPTEVGGPGTVYPQVEATDTAIVLFRQASPAGWSALRIDEHGQPVAKAHWSTDHKTVPVLGLADAAHLELIWLGVNAQSAKGDDDAAAGSTAHVEPVLEAEVHQRATVPWETLPESLGESKP